MKEKAGEETVSTKKPIYMETTEIEADRLPAGKRQERMKEKATPIRNVRFFPAWDRRNPDPKKDYGVHGVEIRMQLLDGDWAAEFVVMTPWMLPAVQDWHKSLERVIGGARVKPTCDVAVHHRGGTKEPGRIAPPRPADLRPEVCDGQGRRAMGHGMCPVFPDAPCENVPVSSFEGDKLYDLLVEGGDEPVWLALEDLMARERSRRDIGGARA